LTKARVAAARSTDPETSHEAAESVWNPSAVQAVVFKIIEDRGPITDTELIWHYGHEAVRQNIYLPSEQSIRSRRAELVTAGQVEFSGLYGVTANGRRSRKWWVSA